MPYVTQGRNVIPPLHDAIWHRNGVRQLSDASPQGRLGEAGYDFCYSYRGNAEVDYNRMSGPELRNQLRAGADNGNASVYDNGHEFRSWKRRFSVAIPHATLETSFDGSFVNPNVRHRYEGPVYPTWTTTYLPGDGSMDLSQLDILGRKAIASTLPTAPEAGLATAFIELKEGIPHLIGASLKKAVVAKRKKGSKVAKAAGDEFLNWEFGYKPLADDIAKAANAVIDFQKNLDKLISGSGKITRAHANLETQTSVQYFPDMGEPGNLYLSRMNAARNEDVFIGSGLETVSLTKRTSQAIWFSGAYTYWLDTSEDFGSKLSYYSQLAESLLGGTITPDVVWAVTPWSWLIDWFADTGTFFKNLSLLQSDHQLLRYGYIMCKTTQEWTKTCSGIYIRPTSNFPSACSSTWTSVSKQRHAASPYGFGIDIGGLSSRRWSILSALGMSKAPGSLRGT